MTVCAHWMPQSLRSWAIIIGFALLPAIVIAAEGVEMSAEGVNKEIQVSDGIAPTISLLNKCGRPDLSRRFIELQDKFLLICGATPEQESRIKRPLQKEYDFADCSMLNIGVSSMEELLAEREPYISSLETIAKLPRTGILTCG